MVARLATRIAKLEKTMPRHEPGCAACRGRFVMFEGQVRRVELDGQKVALCAACGTPMTRPFKFIGGIEYEAL